MKLGSIDILDCKLGSTQITKVMRGANKIWPNEPAYITFDPTSYDTTSSASTFSIAVDSNIAWTATSENTFLTITSGASGNGTGTIHVSVAEHTAETIRTGNIRVEGGGVIKYVGVNQTGAEAGVPDEFLLSGYPLTETSGDAIDVVSGKNLSVYGSMVRPGTHYEFNGNNTYLSGSGIIEHAMVDDNGDVPFTFRVSLNLKSLYRGFIISRRVSSGGGEYQFYYLSGVFYFVLVQKNNYSNNMLVSCDLNSIVGLEEWNRFAITYGGDYQRNSMGIHLNGNKVDNAASGLSSYTGMEITPSETRIGGPEFNSGYRVFGSMKDIRIDKGIALNESQLQKDFEDAEL